MIGSYDQYEVESIAESPCLRVNRPLVSGSWRGIVVGGHPGAYRLVDGARAVEVQARGYAWDQDLVGPLLPIVPLPFGASSYRSEVSVLIRSVEGEAPLSLAVDRIRVRPAGSDAWASQVQWDVADDEEEHRKRRKGLPFRDPSQEPLAEIREGEGIWIDFAADNLETESFEVLVLEGAFGSSPATDQVLKFHRSQDYFCAWFLPF